MAEFTPAAIKAIVGMEALEALDIRVGTVERVEEVPRSEKLMKLTVNFGDHTRTILVGIKKERENPREIEGRQALFVVNLAPPQNGGRDFRRHAI
jgi:tRNA-binding protein